MNFKERTKRTHIQNEAQTRMGPVKCLVEDHKTS